MTGDSSRRKQALSVFLSTLMVLSVLAMGMAGFAGSAAALADQTNDDDGNPISGVAGGFVAANTANPGDTTSTHNISVVNESVPDDTNVQTITIRYPDNSSLDQTNGDDIDQSDITVTNFNGSTNSGSPATVTDLAIGQKTSSGTAGEINVSVSSNAFGATNDIGRLFVEINGVDNSQISDGTTDIEVQLADGSGPPVGVGSPTTVPLELPGAVQVYSDQYDTSGVADGNYTLIGDAVGSGDVTNGDHDLVYAGDGEYREFGNTITVGSDNVTLSGSSGAVLNISGADIDVSDSQNNLVTVEGLTFEGSDDGGSAITDSNNGYNTTVADNEFRNFTATVVDLTPGDDGDEQTTEVTGNSFSEGIDSGAIAVASTDNNADSDIITISNNDPINIASGTAIALTGGSTGTDDVTVSNNVIDADATGTGVSTATNVENLDIKGTTINGTDTGIDITGTGDQYLNISDVDITQSGTNATNIDAGVSEVSISGVTIDDAQNTGIGLTADLGDTLDIDDTSVNNTEYGIALESGAANFQNITNSEVTHANTAGLYAQNESGSGVQRQVHFSTFSDNELAINVETDVTNSGSVDVSFNDIVNNVNGLEVADQGGDSVNANYNWWGDAAGPGGVVDSNSVVDSSGNAVVPKGSSDVTFTPWLSESTDTLDPTSQSLLVIPDASNPYAQSNNADVASADNQLENATVGVVVLDEDTASGEDGISGINLIDSNVDDAEISQGSLQGSDVSKSAGVTQNISANVTGDVEFRAVGDNNAGPDEFTQTFSNDIDSVEVELNRSTLPAGETARATITLYDSNGEVIENTGTPVGFSFSPSDEISVSAEDQITRGGTASAEFTTTTPGQNISVQAFENKNGESATVSLGTATGAVSASESEFNFKGNTVSGNSEDLTGGSAANAGTEHDLSAVIRDSSGNALEDVEVEFNQNTTAEFGDEMPLETDANGVVNTTVTLPEDAGVTTEISIAADDFNPDQTTDANVNVTTQAAAADSLSFANDNIVVPSGQTSEVTVEIVDEFGNHNDGIDSGEIALSSDTSDEISVESSPVSVDADGNATFTLNATAQSGSVNLTATRSGVDDATTTATIGEPQDIQITVDNSSIASGVDNATDVTDVTAQFVDANGDAIGVGSSEIRFTREDGDAAKVNSSAAIDSDSSGAATFEAIATSQTGDTTFELSSPEFDVSNTTTITTTGAPDTIGFSPNVSSPAVNDTVDVTVTVEDSQNRVVPVTAQNYFDMSVQSDAGSFVESDTVRDASDGEGSINVTSSEGGDVTVDAFISAEALNDDTTITFTDQSANYTLELVDGPTTITQNESYSATLRVTNEGEVAGNQTVSYVLEDDTGAATAIDVERAGVELDAGNSTELTFNAPASATAGLATGNYTHVFSSEDDELTVDAEVVEEGAAPAIVGDTPATDTDGDGVYEDVNGDGEFDIVDVNAFFQNYEGQQVQDNADLFDFNDDGEISIVDVNRLFQDSQA